VIDERAPKDEREREKERERERIGGHRLWGTMQQPNLNLNVQAPSFVPSTKRSAPRAVGRGEEPCGPANGTGCVGSYTDDSINLPDDLIDAFTSDFTLEPEKADLPPAEGDGKENEVYGSYSSEPVYGSYESGEGGLHELTHAGPHHQQFYYGDGGHHYLDHPGAPAGPVSVIDAQPNIHAQPFEPPSIATPPPVTHVDEETMRVLQEEFPQYSPQSLAEILEANDYNISVTIDVLTQLELETDYNSQQAPVQLSQVAPALNEINFPSLK